MNKRKGIIIAILSGSCFALTALLTPVKNITNEGEQKWMVEEYGLAQV